MENEWPMILMIEDVNIYREPYHGNLSYKAEYITTYISKEMVWLKRFPFFGQT
jgi:hypothetical protein